MLCAQAFHPPPPNPTIHTKLDNYMGKYVFPSAPPYYKQHVYNAAVAIVHTGTYIIVILTKWDLHLFTNQSHKQWDHLPHDVDSQLLDDGGQDLPGGGQQGYSELLDLLQEAGVGESFLLLLEGDDDALPHLGLQ